MPIFLLSLTRRAVGTILLDSIRAYTVLFNLIRPGRLLNMSDSDTTTVDETVDTITATADVPAEGDASSEASAEVDESAEAAEEDDSSSETPKDDVFRLDAEDLPFKNLMAARDAGEATYKVMLGAFAAVWGKDVEVIEVGFNNTIKAEKAKAEIVTFDKDLAGYTSPNSLIRLLQEGMAIATDGGGSVTFGITLVKGEKGDDGKTADDSASISSSWRGIDGMTSRRGGSGGGGRFQYFDGGVIIEGSLKKYILDKRSGSFAAGRIRKNDADLAAGKKGRLSAFVATTDGKSDGDSFVITRGDKVVTADSTPSS